MPTLYGGKRIITTKEFDPKLMLEIFEKYNVTTTIANPMILPSIFDCDSKPLPSMKFFFIGGLHVTTEMCERSKLLFPNALVCHAYATTETAVLAFNMTNTKQESVGHLYGNVKIKVTTFHK